MPVSTGIISGGGAATPIVTTQSADWMQDATTALVYVLQKSDGTVEYLDAPGGAVIAPTLPLAPLGDLSTSEFVSVCMYDDVASDGSNLVKYHEVFRIVDDGITFTSTSRGNFTDASMQTPYTPLGTTYECGDVGTTTETKIASIELTNGTWSPSALVQEVSIRVITQTGTVTFTDSNGIVTTLADGEILGWENIEDVLDLAPVVSVGVGEIVKITYTYLGTV